MLIEAELAVTTIIPSIFNPFAIALISMRYLLCFASSTASPAAWILLLALVATVFVLLVLRPRFQSFLFLIFILVAWFPEFSQTDSFAWTAADAPTIYNIRPVPTITASLFDYLFAAIFMVWVFKYILPDPRRVLKAPLALSMLVFLAIWVFNLMHGLFVGNAPYNALREFRNGAYFVLMYLMVVTTCKAQEVQKFLKLTLILAALVGVYGVFRFFLGIGVELMDHIIVFYDIADSIILYTALLLGASFSIEGTVTKGKAFLTTALSIPMIFTFLFSYRRGAWVGFFAGLLFLIFLYPGRPRLRRLILRRVFVPAIVIIFLIAAVPAVRSGGLDFVMTRVYSIFDVSEDSSNVFRILDAMNALKSFTQHPIIGVGAGGRYELEFIAKDEVTQEFMDHVSNTSHNAYLFVLFKAGIIGLVAYLAIFVKFLMHWAKVRKLSMGSRQRAVFMALGAILVAMLVTGVTEPVSDLPRPSLLLAFVMSWGASWMRELKDLHSSQNGASPLLIHTKSRERLHGTVNAPHRRVNHAY